MITFEPLQKSHFPLLLKWLETPHVKVWWDKDVVWTQRLIENKYGDYIKESKLEKGEYKEIKAYIIYVDKKPVGYVQIYNAYDFPRDKALTNLPKSLAAFDIFIGEAGYIGKGIGSTALLEFLNIYCEYDYVFADPDKENIAARKAYEKAGFVEISEDGWMLKIKDRFCNK